MDELGTEDDIILKWTLKLDMFLYYLILSGNETDRC
jgi:hypothetical protein